MNRITQKLKNLLREPVPAAKPAAAVRRRRIWQRHARRRLEAMETNLASHENHNSDSELERLPAEVRRLILSVSDLHCLKALIRASPVFHQQYLLDRKFLLVTSITMTLGSVSLDAYAVQKSGDDGLNKAEDRSLGLLETWRINTRQRSLGQFQLADAITEDEAVSMASFYFLTIVPIAKTFAHCALDELARQTINLGDHKFSITEWQRFARATYRFQLLCHVAWSPSSRVASGNTRFLFHTLEPWEVEELYSFYQFAEGIYDKIFDRIRDDLNPENPRFANQERPPTPDGAFEFHNLWARQNFAEGTALRGGLNLLSTVLFDFKDNDQERLVRTMQRSIVSSHIPISTLGGVLDETQQAQRREQEPSPGDIMTEERAPCPFVGDDLKAPPLAWAIIWVGTYSNLYGYYTSDELRQWAYVFWDGDRLQKHGGEELVIRQWESCWDEDPRETL